MFFSFQLPWTDLSIKLLPISVLPHASFLPLKCWQQEAHEAVPVPTSIGVAHIQQYIILSTYLELPDCSAHSVSVTMFWPVVISLQL